MAESILREVKYDDLSAPVSIAKMSDGRDISYREQGKADGYPVFFLHGSPGSRVGPLPQFMTLYQCGIRLISTDRPGYGRATPDDGRRVVDTAYDIKELAKALDIKRFGVMGRSAGVAHALACAAVLGERVQSVVGLVGMSPPHHHDRLDGMTSNNERIHSEALQHEAELRQELGRIAAMTSEDPSWFLRDFLWDQMPTADKAMFNDGGIRELQLSAYKEALAPQGATGWVDDILAVNKPWGFKLPDIKQPVRLLHGELDEFSPYSNSEWIIDKIRSGGNLDAEVHIQPNEAHFYVLKYLLYALCWQRNQAHSEPDNRANL